MRAGEGRKPNRAIIGELGPFRHDVIPFAVLDEAWSVDRD